MVKQQLRPMEWAVGEELQFGPFRLVPGERRLERKGKPVKVGDRALDVLLCLIANAPDVVMKAALIDQVWSGLIVEESNLRFQMAVLRRALGDGTNGERYVATVQGRGYCFVARVSRSLGGGRRPDAMRSGGSYRLPARHARIIGRDDDIFMLSKRLAANRFVSVVGPGEIGRASCRERV